jgi:ketosteroid isomerase-like protein
VTLLMQFRPTDSGAKFEMRLVHLWTMRDGKPARCEVFLRRGEALEAAGLREEQLEPG